MKELIEIKELVTAAMLVCVNDGEFMEPEATERFKRLMVAIDAVDRKYLSSNNKTKGDTPSSAHSYTEGSDYLFAPIAETDFNEPAAVLLGLSINPPSGYHKVYLARGSKYKLQGSEELRQAHRDVNGYFFFKKGELTKTPFVPCSHCDESGCTFNCIGHKPKSVEIPKNGVCDRCGAVAILGVVPYKSFFYNLCSTCKHLVEESLKNAVGPAVHPYPETLQSKLDDLSKAWKVFTNECKDFVFPSVPTMEQKVAAARELWLEFLDDKCVGNFETWLNKKK